LAAGLPPPDIPCPSGQGRCYSQAQLGQVAADLAAQDGDESPYIRSVFSNQSVLGDGDITSAQMQAVWNYFNLEESGKNLVQQDAGNLSSQDQQKMASIVSQLKQDMYGNLIETPFHVAIMDSGDPWADRIMTPGQWQQAQPDNSQAYTYGSEQSLSDGDYSQAVSQAQQALNLDPQSARAYSLKAQAEYGMGNTAAARADAQSALAIDPGSEAAAATLGAIRAIHTAQTGQVAFADIIPGGSVGLGNTPSSEEGKLSGVLRNGEATALVGQAREAMGALDVQAALKESDQAVRLDPKDPQAYFTRAAAYLRLGSPRAALSDLTRAMKLSPKNASIAALKSFALVKAKRFKDALAAAGAALALDPNNAHAWLFRAMALAGLGRREEMIDSLENAVRINPRFEAYLQKARRSGPGEGDLAAVFDNNALAQAPPNSAPASGLSPMRRFAIDAVPALGGLLLLFGLWQGAKAFKRGGSEAMERLPAFGLGAEGSFIDGQVRLDQVLGSGGMGVVYEGRDLRLDRRVAVKKMRGDVNASPRVRDRFIAEARIVARLSHPNIVTIHSVTECAGEIYLVFEFVDGRTLADLASPRRPLALDGVLSVLRGVAEALDYAHRKGVVHRDLKPSNIMVTREGLAKVMDFGIASFASEALTRLTQTGAVLGTPAYMAPEQAMGQPVPQSDVYSLALCAYEALSGRLPFDGTHEGMLKRKIEGPRDPLSRHYKGASERLDAVFAKALDPDPRKRHQSAGQFVDDLAC
jgi:tetratricopeptide (TPR) repeat protein